MVDEAVFQLGYSEFIYEFYNEQVIAYVTSIKNVFLFFIRMVLLHVYYVYQIAARLFQLIIFSVS